MMSSTPFNYNLLSEGTFGCLHAAKTSMQMVAMYEPGHQHADLSFNFNNLSKLQACLSSEHLPALNSTLNSLESLLHSKIQVENRRKMVTVPLGFNILPCVLLCFCSLIYIVNVFLSIVNRRNTVKTNIGEIQAITRGFDQKEPY